MATMQDEKVTDVVIDDKGAEETSATQPEELKNLNYGMLLLGFSLLSVFNIFVLIFAWDQQVKDIVTIIDVPLTIIFLFDFFLRLRTAESKSGHFFKQFGWADLAASIPVPG